MAQEEGTDLARQERSLLGWLAGAEALAAARSELARRRLPTSLADDVVQDAARRVIETMRRRRVPFPELRVGAYARRAVQHAAADVLRTTRRHSVPDSLESLSSEPDRLAELADPRDPLEALVPHLDSHALEDGCRRAVHALLAPRVWAGAASLVVLTLAYHALAEAGPDVPRPDPAAGEERAWEWAGLFYAGREDCFPGPSGRDDAATRKRRSRALEEVRLLLRLALEMVGPDHG